ncbi:unnamed protein product [Prorocentrum cordatum]|uniref:UBX domain-containing protein n=1 Tax=Prorocentrum cordatum TaxID=2364126 RepID=A0ABN9VJM2_9DINO|nr:unnamed protein product [Polarella glacialis]
MNAMIKPNHAREEHRDKQHVQADPQPARRSRLPPLPWTLEKKSRKFPLALLPTLILDNTEIAFGLNLTHSIQLQPLVPIPWQEQLLPGVKEARPHMLMLPQHKAMVSFRIPSGQRVTRRFLPAEPIEQMFLVASALTKEPVRLVDLSTQFPKRALRDIEGGLQTPMKDANVAGNMILVNVRSDA